MLNEWHTEKSTVPGLAPAYFESPEQNMTSLENQAKRHFLPFWGQGIQKASFRSRPHHHTGLRTEFARTHGKPLEAPGSDCLGANVCQGEGWPQILRKWCLSSGTPPLKAIFEDCLLLPTQTPGLHFCWRAEVTRPCLFLLSGWGTGLQGGSNRGCCLAWIDTGPEPGHSCSCFSLGALCPGACAYIRFSI